MLYGELQNVQLKSKVKLGYIIVRYKA